MQCTGYSSSITHVHLHTICLVPQNSAFSCWTHDWDRVYLSSSGGNTKMPAIKIEQKTKLIHKCNTQTQPQAKPKAQPLRCPTCEGKRMPVCPNCNGTKRAHCFRCQNLIYPGEWIHTRTIGRYGLQVTICRSCTQVLGIPTAPKLKAVY